MIMLVTVDALIKYAENKIGYPLNLKVLVSKDRSLFPKKRDLAFCNGEEIVLSDKLEYLPIENQIAVMAHEISHCDFIQKDIEHTEREADKHAEHIFGFNIYYDQDDIQTTSHGKKPRPSWLPK